MKSASDRVGPRSGCSQKYRALSANSGGRRMISGLSSSRCDDEYVAVVSVSVTHTYGQRAARLTFRHHRASGSGPGIPLLDSKDFVLCDQIPSIVANDGHEGYIGSRIVDAPTDCADAISVSVHDLRLVFGHLIFPCRH